MKDFLIGRGHDGPARLGRYKFGEEYVDTPSLVGPVDMSSLQIHYSVFGRGEPRIEGPAIIALPFQKSAFEQAKFELEASKFLLPSLPSIATLGSDVGVVMISQQLALMEEYKVGASDAVLRIPSVLDSGQLEGILTTPKEAGVVSAAFTFDGALGPNDHTNLVLRSRVPRNWIAIALGRIEPASIPLLFYLGFDLLDAGHADEAAALRTRLWRMGSEKVVETSQPRLCSCPSCITQPDLTSLSEGDLYRVLKEHNLWTFKSILSESIQSFRTGTLRWLVESMTHASPSAASMLRKVDKELYSYIEEFTPSSGTALQPLIGPESYNAPSIKRFRDYLEERYSPPDYKKVILLLPCSARKPYSESKSHKRFQRAIESALGLGISEVAETIITSPLGVIPRELERVFPIAQYDIPVSGDWDAEEIQIAVDALVKHLSKFSDSAVVVAHVHGGYLDIVRGAEDQIQQSIIYTTSEQSPTSSNSLDALSETLQDLKEVLSMECRSARQLEEILRATADFQFGFGTGAILIPDNSKLGGKPYRMITCRVEGEQVCAYIASSGSLSLTLDGAELLSPLNRYWVRFEGPLLKGGSLFAVGIEDADYRIRPGDEVIILSRDNNVIGVGRSEMSGSEMCEFNNGRAISVRHKVEVK